MAKKRSRRGLEDDGAAILKRLDDLAIETECGADRAEVLDALVHALGRPAVRVLRRQIFIDRRWYADKALQRMDAEDKAPRRRRSLRRRRPASSSPSLLSLF